MDVVIAGGHGQIALKLIPLLVERGDRVRALIRNPDHSAEVEALGAEPLIADLEADDEATLTEKIGSADAIVFAAGAGPGSGAERKNTLDRDGAIKLMHVGVDRYVIVSAINAVEPLPQGDEVMDVYTRAKAAADEALRASGLNHTIVRPGRLTDDAPTGKVAMAPRLEYGEIPRADVAAVLAAVLHEDSTFNLEFDLVSGDNEIDTVIDALVRGRSENLK